jgi:LPS-assembly lipoprotein
MLWSKATALALTCSIILLSSCGFAPLYRHQSNSVGLFSHFAVIEIAPIESRLGQKLRNHLQDKLTPDGKPSEPLYKLIITISDTRNDVVILKDATSTFAKITLRARYKLKNLNKAQVVTSGTTIATTGFNITQSEYVNIQAENGAQSRLAEQISMKIEKLLALFLKSAINKD